MSIKYVLLPIISSLIVTFKSCSWNETDIAELQSNLTTAIDSVRLNPVDYYGYIFNITYPDYLYIKKRLYMLRYYDKDSTKRFYTGYGINERTMQIISGPEYSDMDNICKLFFCNYCNFGELPTLGLLLTCKDGMSHYKT